MALTYEEIWKSADMLIETGTKPTLEAVRRQLGGVGSWGTITAAMVEWRKQRATVEVQASEPLPALISDRLMRVGIDMWASAQETANARLENERAALESERALHDAGRQEAAALADQLSTNIEHLQASQQALEHTLASTQGELAQMQRALAVAEARLCDLQQQVASAQDGERRAIAEAAELRGRLEVLGSETWGAHKRRASGKGSPAAVASPE